MLLDLKGFFSSENEILIPDMEATKARLLETIYGSCAHGSAALAAAGMDRKNGFKV